MADPLARAKQNLNNLLDILEDTLDTMSNYIGDADSTNNNLSPLAIEASNSKNKVSPLVQAVVNYFQNQTEENFKQIKRVIFHEKINLFQINAEHGSDSDYLCLIITALGSSVRRTEEVLTLVGIDWKKNPIPLYWAAETEKLNLVREWLKLPEVKALVNVPLPEGYLRAGETALIGACKGDTPALLEALLDAGADIEQAALFGPSKGFNPLATAADDGKLENIKLLLKRGAGPDHVIDGQGALSFAAKINHFAAVKLLLESSKFSKNKIPADSNVSHMRTAALIFAIQNNSLPIYYILREGVNLDLEISMRGVFGNILIHRPIHTAIYYRNIVFLADLLARGVSINSPILQGIHEGLIPICSAVLSDFPEAIQRLLSHNADINYVVQTGLFVGLSPLALACRERNNKIVKTLLENGADLNGKVYPGTKNEVPLMLFAAQQKNFDAVKLLLEAGVDPKQIITAGNYKGKTLWSIAFALADEIPELIATLLSHKYKVPYGKVVEIINSDVDPIKAARDENLGALAKFLKSQLQAEESDVQEQPVKAVSSKEKKSEVEDRPTSLWFEKPKATNEKTNLEVARESYQNPELPILLLNARYESKLANEIVKKESKSLNDFYVLALHLLRKYEALYRYAQQTGDESIVSARDASVVRNIIMHLFFAVDEKKLYEFAKVDSETVHTALMQKLNSKTDVKVNTQSIIKTELYRSLMPSLKNADNNFDVDMLREKILAEMQMLVLHMSHKKKEHIMWMPTLCDEIKMRLTLIGQYARLLQGMDNNFNSFCNYLSGFLQNVKDESVCMTKARFFLKSCIHIRTLVGHDFSGQISADGQVAEDERLSIGRTYKMLVEARSILGLLREDLAFELDRPSESSNSFNFN